MIRLFAAGRRCWGATKPPLWGGLAPGLRGALAGWGESALMAVQCEGVHGDGVADEVEELAVASGGEAPRV